MITDAFGQQLLTTINTTDENPVHLLFNQWWNEAPDGVKQQPRHPTPPGLESPPTTSSAQ